MANSHMKAYGHSLAQLGYSIVPIMPGTKKPGNYYGGKGIGWTDMPGWSSFGVEPASEKMIEKWSVYPDAGIGVVTGNVIAVDIDILDEEVANRVEQVIVRHLGPTRAVRVGKWPKRLLVYRAVAPFSKIKAGCIEVLAQGQQFVAYAKHPDTGMDYRWTDGELHSIPIALLPVVSETQVRDAVNEATDILPDELRVRRLVVVSNTDVAESEHGLTAHPEAIASAAASLQNPDYIWDDWNRVGMALWAATSGSDVGLQAFHDFSSASSKYDERETNNRWASYFRSKPTSVGAGTIFHLARESGWVPPTSLDFHQGVVDTSDVAEEIAAMKKKLEVVHTAPEPVEPKVEQTPTKPTQGYLFAKPDGQFPYDEWLGDNISRIAQIANWITDTAMYPHPTFALFNTLSMLGVLFGRRYKLQLTNTRTNLMCIAIAPSGSGKDHSRKKIKQLMEESGMIDMIGGDDFSSGAGIVTMLHDYPSRLSHIDEMGKFMEGITNDKAPQYRKDVGKKLLEFFTTSGSTYRGGQMADSKLNKRKDIINPNLCIFGTSTLSTITNAFKYASREDGTISRILLVDALSDPLPVKVDVMKPLDADAVQWLRSYMAYSPEGNLGNMMAADIDPNLIDVTWGDGAYDMYYSLLDWQHQLKSRGTFWTRFGENTLKLAMISAIADDMVTPCVKKSHLQNAIDLVYWCMRYTERLIREESAENETEARLKRLLKEITSSEHRGITKTELLKGSQSIGKRERDEAIATLKETGQIVEVVEQTNSRGPKPVRYLASQYAA